MPFHIKLACESLNERFLLWQAFIGFRLVRTLPKSRESFSLEKRERLSRTGSNKEKRILALKFAWLLIIQAPETQRVTLYRSCYKLFERDLFEL